MDATNDLVLDSVVVRNSQADTDGGGMNVFAGDLTLIRSAIRTNMVTGDAGGGFGQQGDAIIINSTISNNSADRSGGFHIDGDAVLGIGGTLTLRNSVVANNTASTIGNRNEFWANVLAAASFSLVERSSSPSLTNGTNGNITAVNPNLGPLQDNGGPTLTRVPLRGSPLIDVGQNSTCAATDQRGCGPSGRLMGTLV